MTKQRTVLAFGDSGTGLTDSADSTFGSPGVAPSGNAFSGSYGLLKAITVLARQCWDIVSDRGVVGDTTTQMLARIKPDCLDIDATDVFYFSPFSNDTLSGSGIAIAQSINNMEAIIEANLAKGRHVWIVTVPPRIDFVSDLTALQNALAGNVFLKTMEQKHERVHVSTIWASVQKADFSSWQNSAQPNTAFYLDGYHLNSAGAYAGALEVMQDWKDILPKPANDNLANVISANPLMVGTPYNPGVGGLTGVIPPGYYADRMGAISAVGSVITRATAALDFPELFGDGKPGNVTRLDLSGATATSDKFSLIMGPLGPLASGSLPNLSGRYVVEAELGIKTTTNLIRSTFLQTIIYYGAGPSLYDNREHSLADPSLGPDSLATARFAGLVRSRGFYTPNTIVSPQCNISFITDIGAVGFAMIGRPNWRKVA